MATGTVRKRGDSWYFVHRVDDRATGKRRQKWMGGFVSRKDAQRALRESLSAEEHGLSVEPTKLTYAQFVEQVWLPGLLHQLEGSTRESYTRNMRVHVL